MCTIILQKCFKFYATHFTGYGVIAENPRVGHLGCMKNYMLDCKNNWHFFDGLNVLYHHAKFGEDRTTLFALAVGAKIWCVYLYFCFFVTLQGRMLSFEGVYFK